MDTDYTKWRQQVLGSHLFKQVNTKSRVLFSMDLKNQCVYLGKDGNAPKHVYRVSLRWILSA